LVPEEIRRKEAGHLGKPTSRLPFIPRPSSLRPSTMACRFEITERVQFSETDMAGIVHFSNFFRYMERVEHAFFSGRWA
jgi:hypothetical protein